MVGWVDQDCPQGNQTVCPVHDQGYTLISFMLCCIGKLTYIDYLSLVSDMIDFYSTNQGFLLNLTKKFFLALTCLFVESKPNEVVLLPKPNQEVFIPKPNKVLLVY